MGIRVYKKTALKVIFIMTAGIYGPCFVTTVKASQNTPHQCQNFWGRILNERGYVELQVNQQSIRLVSAIGIDRRLVEEALNASQDEQVQKEINALVTQELHGNRKPNLGRFSIGQGYYELRGAHGARVFIRRLNAEDDKVVYVIIVGKATKKGKSNFNRVFALMRKVFPDFPQTPPKHVKRSAKKQR